MKGKGKAPQDKEKPVDVKDCPLLFPELTMVDHVTECPRYTQVLSRGSPGISHEELATLQTDIEALLAGVGRRLKLLNDEHGTLSAWPQGGKQEGRKTNGGKGQGEGSSRASTPTKRKGPDDKDRDSKEPSKDPRPPSKKYKDSAGKPTPAPSTPVHKSKGKNAQIKGPPDEGSKAPDSATPDLPPKLLIHKNDAVNRFWASVEPFCAPITQDDLRVIEDVLKSYEEETEYMKVPPLGLHYTKRWAQEDLSDEHTEGAKISKRSSGAKDNHTEQNSSEPQALLKRAEKHKTDHFMDDSPFGPLTQRLVSALIEDNLMTNMEDSMADTAECGSPAPAPMSPRMLAKQLNIGNPGSLERRIRRELEEQGILEKEEEEEDDPNDEVLAELRRRQQELRAISQSNMNILKALYRQGQEDIQRQALKKKLQTYDSEILEAYRKVQNAKQRKKSPTKKEKEAVIKLLKEREAVNKALEL